MGRGGHHAGVRRDHARNVARVHEHLAAEERAVDLQQARVVRQPVKTLELLDVVVGVGGDADIRPVHLLLGDGIDGVVVDQPAEVILPLLPPAVFFHDREHLRPHGQHLILGQSLFKKQIPIDLRPLPQRDGISQQLRRINEFALGSGARGGGGGGGHG